MFLFVSNGKTRGIELRRQGGAFVLPHSPTSHGARSWSLPAPCVLHFFMDRSQKDGRHSIIRGKRKLRPKYFEGRNTKKFQNAFLENSTRRSEIMEARTAMQQTVRRIKISSGLVQRYAKEGDRRLFALVSLFTY